MAKPNLNRLEYFVAIAEAGSITGAAARMRVSKAVVSKQLQLLEQEVGEALIIRNPRHMNLTQAGEVLFEGARSALAQAEETFERLREGRASLSGTLRIAAPLDFGLQFVAPFAATFRQAHPDLMVELNVSDIRHDPVKARFDIAYRAGWLSDSANLARKISEFDQLLVCTPELFEALGRPDHPDALAQAPFIENRALTQPLRLSFSGPSGDILDVTMQAALSIDITMGVKALTVRGAGLAVLPSFQVKDELSNGLLTHVAPNWHLRRGGLYSVLPATRFRSAATQAFLDQFQNSLPNRI